MENPRRYPKMRLPPIFQVLNPMNCPAITCHIFPDPKLPIFYRMQSHTFGINVHHRNSRRPRRGDSLFFRIYRRSA